MSNNQSLIESTNFDMVRDASRPLMAVMENSMNVAGYKLYERREAHISPDGVIKITLKRQIDDEVLVCEVTRREGFNDKVKQTTKLSKKATKEFQHRWELLWTVVPKDDDVPPLLRVEPFPIPYPGDEQPTDLEESEKKNVELKTEDRRPTTASTSGEKNKHQPKRQTASPGSQDKVVADNAVPEPLEKRMSEMLRRLNEEKLDSMREQLRNGERYSTTERTTGYEESDQEGTRGTRRRPQSTAENVTLTSIQHNIRRLKESVDELQDTVKGRPQDADERTLESVIKQLDVLQKRVSALEPSSSGTATRRSTADHGKKSGLLHEDANEDSRNDSCYDASRERESKSKKASAASGGGTLGRTLTRSSRSRRSNRERKMEYEIEESD